MTQPGQEPRLRASRTVERLVAGTETSDGAGVRLTRVLTQPLQRRLDPFLMLDAFGSDDPDEYIAGFPDHPHRGFETITYMINGRMQHRDSAGHEGVLENGDVQWMTAGRGIIHSEIPQQEHGLMEGFQLWLNLAAKDKSCPPWYGDLRRTELPRLTTEHGVEVTVIAGSCRGIDALVQRERTDPLYLDIHLPAGSSFSQPLPPENNAFVYTYRGSVSIGDTAVPIQRMGILANDPAADGVTITAHEDAHVLLIAGRPLGEPIVQYGPFVMNSEDEIRQTLQEYRDGRLGQQ